MVMQQKTQSIKLPIFCKEAKLTPTQKCYNYPQCYYRVRMKISNHQKSPVYQNHI